MVNQTTTKALTLREAKQHPTPHNPGQPNLESETSGILGFSRDGSCLHYQGEFGVDSLAITPEMSQRIAGAMFTLDDDLARSRLADILAGEVPSKEMPFAVEAIMANPFSDQGLQNGKLFDDSAYRQQPSEVPASTIDTDGQDPSWGKPPVQRLCEQADEILAHPIYQEPEPTVDIEDLRDWYRQANALGRSPQHLNRIESVGKAVKVGLDAYGPKDEAARERDRREYKAQSSNVYAMAKYLLKRVGQEQPDGAISFQGKTYGLSDQDGELEVSAQGRGTILAAQAGGTVCSCALVASDVERFKAFVSRVRQHEQERPVAKVSAYER